MPQGQSGISANTADRMILDAGEAYFNIDLAKLEGAAVGDGLANALAAGTKVGATRGGSSFTLGRTLRQMEADGLLGPTKGMIRRGEVAPVLTLNLLEMTPENIIKAIAGATGADTGGTDNMQKITGGEITAASYISNVALLATYSGTTNPVIVVVENALVLDAPDFGTSDEDEMVLAVPFAGTFDPANPSVEPWRVYHPDTIV